MPAATDTLLARMEQFPTRVTRLVENESLDALRRAGANGSWGAVEILAYLRDLEFATTNQVDEILDEDVPQLTEIDEDLVAIERNYHAQDPFDSLAGFRAARSELVKQLRQLPPASWQRTAHHPTLGTITLLDLIEHHDERDNAQLKALKDVLL
ncbi:MAG TPA: hypothetical protein VKU87_07210 [Thermomicrobiaceae bacterium]|nr:hypothetical protein [Thermomicrobiaceae bacterium]